MNYWLRAVVDEPGASQGRIVVHWSTDATNFVKVLEATGLTNVRGEAGVSTAGPHLPHTQFDDFRLNYAGSTAPDLSGRSPNPSRHVPDRLRRWPRFVLFQ